MIGFDGFRRVGADEANASAAFENKGVAVDDALDAIRAFGERLRQGRLRDVRGKKAEKEKKEDQPDNHQRAPGPIPQ
jgi:hypothetical protein